MQSYKKSLESPWPFSGEWALRFNGCKAMSRATNYIACILLLTKPPFGNTQNVEASRSTASLLCGGSLIPAQPSNRVSRVSSANVQGTSSQSLQPKVWREPYVGRSKSSMDFSIGMTQPSSHAVLLVAVGNARR